MTLALSDPFVPEALSSSDHYERLFWLTRIADGDTTALAEDVLSRIRLDSENEQLLDIASSDQRTVEGHLGMVASQRLAAQPIDQLHYTQTIGHPLNASKEAFEQAGEPTLAAAYFALIHDKLTRSAVADDLGPVRAALRFAVARSLVVSNPEAAEGCRELVRQTLDGVSAADQASDTLCQDMTAWLAADDDLPPSSVLHLTSPGSGSSQ